MMIYRAVIFPVICAVAALATTQCADQAQPELNAEVATPSKLAVIPGKVTGIDLPDFYALHQSGRVLVYDVRPVFYHSVGHIPGSINWPKSAFDGQLAAREPEIRTARRAGRVVVLYCTDAACPDARAVAERLAERGHDVSVLEGGWEMWKAAGLPT